MCVSMSSFMFYPHCFWHSVCQFQCDSPCTRADKLCRARLNFVFYPECISHLFPESPTNMCNSTSRFALQYILKIMALVLAHIRLPHMTRCVKLFLKSPHTHIFHIAHQRTRDILSQVVWICKCCGRSYTNTGRDTGETLSAKMLQWIIYWKKNTWTECPANSL